MRWRLVLWATVATACSTPPPPASPPPPSPPLAVLMPAHPVAVYQRSDSALVEIDAQGETLRTEARVEATLTLHHRETPEGLEVRVVFDRFRGSVTSPLGPPQEASEAEIEGPLVLRVGQRGAASVVARPSLGERVAEFLSGEQTALHLFPRLPAQVVTPGDAWSDTVRVSFRQGSATVASESVIRSYVMADTLIAGAPHLLVRVLGRRTQKQEGGQGDVELSQEVAGDLQGHYLWDLDGRRLRSLEMSAVMTGTLRMSVVPFPLSVRVRSTSRTVLGGH